MATTIKQGTDLILFWDDNGTFKPILQTTSHQLEETVETKEVTCKDDGDAVQEIPVKDKWSISADGLASWLADQDYFKLKELKDAKTPIAVVLGQKEKVGESLEMVDGTKYLKGSALITKLSFNAPDKSESTYSFSLSGQGALEIFDYVAV